MQPSIQRDHSKRKDKIFEIIVNGRMKSVEDKFLTFVEIVKLAFGEFKECQNQIYTMTFKRGVGNKEGSLVLGDKVRIKDGVIFNVTATNKS